MGITFWEEAEDGQDGRAPDKKRGEDTRVDDGGCGEDCLASDEVRGEEGQFDDERCKVSENKMIEKKWTEW